MQRRGSEKLWLAASAVNRLAERWSRAVGQQPALALPLPRLADLTLGHADERKSHQGSVPVSTAKLRSPVVAS